jgi:hypothetical protein
MRKATSYVGCGAWTPEGYSSDGGQERGLGLRVADSGLVHYLRDPGRCQRRRDGEGCPDAMHDGIDTAEDLVGLISNEVRAFGRRKIRRDQPRLGPAVLMTCGHDNARPLRDEQFRDGRTHAACSAGHKYPLAIQSLSPVLKADRFGPVGIRASRKGCTHRSIPFCLDTSSIRPPRAGRPSTMKRTNPLPGERLAPHRPGDALAGPGRRPRPGRRTAGPRWKGSVRHQRDCHNRLLISNACSMLCRPVPAPMTR